MARPHIIITGFRAFPGVANNPSAMVVEALADAGGNAAECHLLDTVYNRARERIGALLDTEPAALVLTGYSREATGIVLETQATAMCLPDRPDAAGQLPAIPEQSCDHTNSAVDAAALVTALRAQGLPASISGDAGGYLCNHVFWQALDLIAARQLSTRAVFVHLPRVAGMEQPPEGAGDMALDDLARGVAVIAQALSKQHRA